MTQALKWLHKAEETFAGVFIFVVVATISLQIFCRYILNNALPWPEEVAKFCFVWGIFLGAVIGVRRRNHIAIEAGISRLPLRPRLALRVVIYAAVIVILAILALKGVDMVRMSSTSILPAINIKVAYLYLPLPIASVLMIVDYIGLLLDAVRRYVRGEDTSENSDPIVG